MEQTIDVTFGQGMRIDATLEGSHTIHTDQKVKDGGEGSAPNPFELFLASLATCAGVYARRFCEARNIATQGMALRVTCTYAPKGFQVTHMRFTLTPPPGFPEEYRAPLIRAVELCTVKKHIVHPPEFSVELT